MTAGRLAPEQHDTLDGVPEPSENPSLFGHEDARRALAEAHRAGRLPHGLILAGPPGIGKATLAFHLARHVLRFPDGTAAPDSVRPPDTASPLFRQVASGAHPAVLHLNRPFDEKNKRFRTVIAVDEVRRIGRFLAHTVHDGGYRAVIVDAVDDMNVQAANALLKNLEEPPSRTLFVLIAHALGRVLPTLRSRCQVVKLAPLGADDLTAALLPLAPDLPADAEKRRALADRAGGSVRQALTLLRHGGLEIAGALDSLVASSRFDPVAAHKLAEAVGGKGQDTSLAILNERALELLAEAADQAVRRGELARAAALADAWRAEAEAAREAAAFNLDRKQSSLELMGRVHRALNG